MIRWILGATIDKLDDAGGFIAGPYRGVLHRTEGSSYAGARSSYVKNRSAPHFTVGTEGLWQHIALDRAARALENPPGGVQTNLQSAIQIEVIGFSKDPWPDRLVTVVRDLMIKIEDETGIKPFAPPFGDQDGAFGLRTVYRMQPESWVRFDGWCGHQHVPEQLHGHWDPGKAPIDQLLQREGARAMPDANNYPAQAPVVTMVATPTGKGYWILTADGAVFGFGDAEYFGRVTAPTQ